MIGFKNRVKIQRVSPEFLCAVIEDRIPHGHFLTKDGRKWVAVEFTRKRQAIRWLRGEYEVC